MRAKINHRARVAITFLSASHANSSYSKEIWPKRKRELRHSKKYSQSCSYVFTSSLCIPFIIIIIAYYGCHQNGLCEQCRTDEALEHYLFECPKYHLARQLVIETAGRHNVNLNLLHMVRNLYTRVSLVEFVLTTGKEI